MNNQNVDSGSVYIDPSYDLFYKDKLFEAHDDYLNRDGQLEPFRRVRAQLQKHGKPVHTADMLWNQADNPGSAEYFSLGLLKNIDRVGSLGNVSMRAFVIMEPPVVAPQLYRSLPRLTSVFQNVYLHNVHGDGYSLNGVNRERLRKFYWPLPYRDVLSGYWEKRDRQHRIVVINGNHIPKKLSGELYSRRISAITALSSLSAVDLYGHGWDKWWSRRSMWPPYWLNRRALMSVYRGSCVSKYDVLSRYEFCLCFENMIMEGYLTEKLFDCLYAGTIPLYLGAPDIEQLVPSNVYIDCRRYDNWQDLWDSIRSMPETEIEEIRQAGREFLESDEITRYYDSLLDIVMGRDAGTGTGRFGPAAI